MASVNDQNRAGEDRQAVDLLDWAKHNPGKGAPHADCYWIAVDDEHGFDQRLIIEDPKPTGRQVLETAGLLPPEEHMLLLLQSDGMLEEINLSETVELRRPGAERFLTFRSDRILYFELDGRRFSWGAETILENTLRKLARVPENYNVWLERRGDEDRLLEPGAVVELAPEGLERFYTGIDETKAGLHGSAVPAPDRRYLGEHGVAYKEVAEGERKGLILSAYALPDHLDAASADVLVILPAGYPDVPPDMFHTYPWVRIRSINRYPNRADQPVSFGGRKWQRWSRHNKEWRPGVDGIWTMLRRIDTALQGAE